MKHDKEHFLIISLIIWLL